MKASWVWVVVGVVVLAVGGGVYLAENSKTPKLENSKTDTSIVASPTPTPEAVSGNVTEVVVEGANFKFTPATIKAKKGDTVKLTFKSAGGIHDLIIDEFDVQTSQLGEGEEEEVEFVADKTGAFEYYCSVGNHRKMGMVGKLIVE